MFHTPVFVQQLKSRDISFFTKRQEISRFQSSWHLCLFHQNVKTRTKAFQVQKDLRLDVMS